MKTAIITVAADGTLTIETVGFKGSSCEAATKALEEALGQSTGSKKKPEYYQQTTGQQTIGGAS